MDSKHRWEHDAYPQTHRDLPPPEYSTLRNPTDDFTNSNPQRPTISHTPLRTQTTYTARIGFVPSNPLDECTLNPGDLIYVESVSTIRPGWVVGFNVTAEGLSPKGPMRLLPWACLDGVENNTPNMNSRGTIADTRNLPSVDLLSPMTPITPGSMTDHMGMYSSTASTGFIDPLARFPSTATSLNESSEYLGHRTSTIGLLASASSRSVSAPSPALISNALARSASLTFPSPPPPLPPADLKLAKKSRCWSPFTIITLVAVAIVITLAAVVAGMTLGHQTASPGASEESGSNSSDSSTVRDRSAPNPGAVTSTVLLSVSGPSTSAGVASQTTTSATQAAAKTSSVAAAPAPSPTGTEAGTLIAQQCTTGAYLCDAGKLFTCNTQSLKWELTSCASVASSLGSSHLSVPGTCVNGIGVFGVQRNRISGVNVCPCNPVGNGYCANDSTMVKCIPMDGQLNGILMRKSCGGSGSCTDNAKNGKANCGAGDD
ncbi:hypothetical protein BJ742DRAFT_101072 [Cladochytrium replicatum]|nr:hypothetical protein BJ742DRAFT_101072 [Cladochytrium replicatum]